MTTPIQRPVLVVDDDRAVLNSLLRVLRGRFIAYTATSPMAALDVLRAHPNEFFAIVTDVHMPEMDGATFLHRAALISRLSRTVLISGAIDTDVLMRAVNGPGVFRALMKPVAPRRLLSALEDAWAAYTVAVPASLQESLSPALTRLIDAARLRDAAHAPIADIGHALAKPGGSGA